jgi:hypothetical protein
MPIQPTLVHYDFASMRYSSFYSTGFSLNAPRFGYRFKISRMPPPLFDVPGLAESRRQDRNRNQCLLYRFKSSTEDFFFCIDTLDHNLNYTVPLLQNVELYFKVNYHPDFVPTGPDVAPYVSRIQPILPFFPLRSGSWTPRIPRLIPSRQMAWDNRDILRRIIDEPRVPTLEALKTLRGRGERYDVFFVSAYYAEEALSPVMEFRHRVMTELDGQGLQRSVFGFAQGRRSRSEIPEPFNRYALPWFSFRDYLRTLAQARVAIYVRGVLDCISFKFGEYMCLGLPVVGQTMVNDRERLAHLPYFDEQFAFDEPADIARQAAALVGQEDKRHVLSQSNARVFDEVLSPESVTADVLEHLGMRRHRN